MNVKYVIELKMDTKRSDSFPISQLRLVIIKNNYYFINSTEITASWQI